MRIQEISKYFEPEDHPLLDAATLVHPVPEYVLDLVRCVRKTVPGFSLVLNAMISDALQFIQLGLNIKDFTYSEERDPVKLQAWLDADDGHKILFREATKGLDDAEDEIWLGQNLQFYMVLSTVKGFIYDRE